jgi:hypothetical protein
MEFLQNLNRQGAAVVVQQRDRALPLARLPAIAADRVEQLAIGRLTI